MPDLAQRPYVHTEHGRRPLTVLAALAAGGMTVLAIAAGAPWYIYPPILFALAGTLWLVLRNPVSGCRLTVEAWTFHGAGFDRSIPRTRIDRVSLRTRSDGADEVTLHLTDGTALAIPSRCLPTPEALRPELARAGIDIAD